MATPEALFDKLWAQYAKLTPQAQKIRSLLEERGEHVVNDHVAFRTFDDPRPALVVAKGIEFQPGIGLAHVKPECGVEVLCHSQIDTTGNAEPVGGGRFSITYWTFHGT